MSDFDLTPPGQKAESKGTSSEPRAVPQPSTLSPHSSASPIADLSYRNYDGPLHNRAARWWIVALANIRITRKKPGFWILALVAFLPYIVTLLMLQFTGGNPNGPMSSSNLSSKFTTQFFQALSNQQFWIFLMALLVGTGCIAADNRANALLVYLSKPITKGDYLLGKWMGVFLILFAICFLPALILFVYCALSYSADGFFRNEPSLWWRMLLATIVPAAVHASLLVGFSAWSKTPRMAGAIYASVYLVSGIITGIVGGLQFRAHPDASRLITHLSISGAIQGLAQNILHVTLDITQFRRRQGEMATLHLAPPSFWAMLGLTAGLIVLGVLAARTKVKAVEVVRG